jgi:hypothetical protein
VLREPQYGELQNGSLFTVAVSNQQSCRGNFLDRATMMPLEYGRIRSLAQANLHNAKFGFGYRETSLLPSKWRKFRG